MDLHTHTAGPYLRGLPNGPPPPAPPLTRRSKNIYMSAASLGESLTELAKHREEIGDEQDYAAVRQLIIREHFLMRATFEVQKLDFTDLLRNFEGGAEPLGTAKAGPSSALSSTNVMRAVLVFAGPQSVGHIMCAAASLRTQAHRALPFALAMRARVWRSRSIDSTAKRP